MISLIHSEIFNLGQTSTSLNIIISSAQTFTEHLLLLTHWPTFPLWCFLLSLLSFWQTPWCYQLQWEQHLSIGACLTHLKRYSQFYLYNWKDRISLFLWLASIQLYYFHHSLFCSWKQPFPPLFKNNVAVNTAGQTDSDTLNSFFSWNTYCWYYLNSL